MAVHDDGAARAPCPGIDCEDEEERCRLEALMSRFPAAMPGELLRFCRARPKSVDEAAGMYERHLQWRRGDGHPDRLAAAFRALPPNYCRPAGRARDGSPTLLVQGARYDPELGPEQHVLGLCHVMDQSMDPNDSTRWTMLLEARPAQDWNNVPAHRMVPFFKLCASVLPDNYPERVQRIVIYPMPGIVKQLWWACRSFVDERTRSKIEVISGASAVGSPCPKELGKFVSFEQLPEDAQGMHRALLEVESAECNSGSSSTATPRSSISAESDEEAHRAGMAILGALVPPPAVAPVEA